MRGGQGRSRGPRLGVLVGNSGGACPGTFVWTANPPSAGRPSDHSGEAHTRLNARLRFRAVLTRNLACWSGAAPWLPRAFANIGGGWMRSDLAQAAAGGLELRAAPNRPRLVRAALCTV